MSEKQKSKTRNWKCTQCKAACLFDESNPFRPFCSERCRNFDKANWATDNYKIPGPSVDPEQELGEPSEANASGQGDSEPDS